MKEPDPEPAWDERGLCPAVVQDAVDGRVLMLGWMNREALELTLCTGYVHFWSRSRTRIWKKGETTGNYLRCISVNADCDVDALLVRVQPAGPVCHTGEASCFFRTLWGAGPHLEPSAGAGLQFLARLSGVIESRRDRPAEGSYTSTLLSSGTGGIMRKVGEEAAELMSALACESDERVLEEAADLLFHCMVLLAHRRLSLEQVCEVLERRASSRPARDGV
jgi:phosphoribosyl-AMP cyclohydrolase / phosphoribosyl-ATP pyrophosphohydrolase